MIVCTEMHMERMCEGMRGMMMCFLIQNMQAVITKKGKKTCIRTTVGHYTLLCVHCFAGTGNITHTV